jgi:hypothetical protein
MNSVEFSRKIFKKIKKFSPPGTRCWQGKDIIGFPLASRIEKINKFQEIPEAKIWNKFLQKLKEPFLEMGSKSLIGESIYRVQRPLK